MPRPGPRVWGAGRLPVPRPSLHSPSDQTLLLASLPLLSSQPRVTKPETSRFRSTGLTALEAQLGTLSDGMDFQPWKSPSTTTSRAGDMGGQVHSWDVSKEVQIPLRSWGG